MSELLLNPADRLMVVFTPVRMPPATVRSMARTTRCHDPGDRNASCSASKPSILNETAQRHELAGHAPTFIERELGRSPSAGEGAAVLAPQIACQGQFPHTRVREEPGHRNHHAQFQCACEASSTQKATWSQPVS